MEFSALGSRIALFILICMLMVPAFGVFPALGNGVTEANGNIVFVSNRDGNNEIYVMNADGSGQTRLTNNYATDATPSWQNLAGADGGPSTNGKIAFTSNRDGNNEIYVMNADGSDPTRLTSNSANEDDARWSPDGSKIAFTSDRDGNSEIYTMNADGTGQTRLTNNIHDDYDSSWQPLHFTSFQQVPKSNGKIVFQSFRDGNWEIYTMNADGSGLTRLTNNTFADEWPSWSPNGTKILFSSNREGDNMEIWVMNVDGTGATRLTYATGHDYQPCTSPDGTKIAFASTRDGNYEIYMMNSDGTGQTRLTNNYVGDDYPRWSPDGTKILFESERDGNWEIYVMNTDGSGQTKLTSNSNEDPCWSPNGTKIMFTTPHDSIEEIWVMNANGTEQAKVTNSSARDYLPNWSPDGTKVVFLSTRDGNNEIYTMNPDGSGQTRLTNNSADDYDASWQPLFFTNFQQIGVGTDFTGNMLNLNGTTFTASQLPASFAKVTGTFYSFSWSSPLTVSGDKRYVWSSTSGLSTERAGNFTTIAGTGSLNATYRTQYYVAFMNATGGTVNRQSGWFDASSTINIIATASSGYFANGWEMSGGIQFISGSDENMVIRVDGPGSVTPSFELADQVPPSITVIRPTNGSSTTSGNVTISASYSDNVAVDPTSVVLKVDGSSVTSGATITASGVSYNATLAVGSHSVELTVNDTSGNPQTAIWAFTVQQPTKSGCFIATATYGSASAPQVQALRDFRDGIAMKTFAGSSFMYGFLTWYYSWSPPVADSIAPSDSARAAMQVILQPLLSILQAATATFFALSFSGEFAIVSAGFVAAALIGSVYFMPLTALILVGTKRARRDLALPSASVVLRFTAVPWGISIALIAMAEIAASPALMMVATLAFVVLTMLMTVGTISFWLASLYRRG